MSTEIKLAYKIKVDAIHKETGRVITLLDDFLFNSEKYNQSEIDEITDQMKSHIDEIVEHYGPQSKLQSCCFEFISGTLKKHVKIYPQYFCGFVVTFYAV